MLALLPGERLLRRCEGVKHLLVADGSVEGVLFFTSFRVAFVPADPTVALVHPFHAFQVPLLTIAKTERRVRYVLAIIGKDVRTNRLDMRQADWFRGRNQGNKQLKQAWDELLKMLVPPEQLGLCFAFDYSNAMKESHSQRSVDIPDGWHCYTPEREYTRLGLLSADQNNHEFRLLTNKRYQLYVAHFRKLNRLPVAVWRHPVYRGVLVRASAPTYRSWRGRCTADEKLLSLYRNAANGESPLYILDTRASSVTHRNLLSGESVEKAQRYDNAVIEFLGLASIRKVRDSFDALKALVSDVKDGDRKYHYRLDNTQWLDNIMHLLTGASRVAKILNTTGASVVIHGANGWDSTPQLCSLAQLILDPYYRTIQGFIVLVEKEWCSFGHKFEERLGLGNKQSVKLTERCPIMLQFLDCVWQMTNQFATGFEFNDVFLFHVHDALISGLYGTFLYDSERTRLEARLPDRTQSAWPRVLEDPVPFTNPHYRPTTQALFPYVNLKRIVLWDAMYFRWDPDSQPSRSDEENGISSSSRDHEMAPTSRVDMPSKNWPAWYIHESEVDIIEKPFSKGSFGTVHHGYWAHGSPVVIKRLIVDSTTSKRTMDAFMREVKIWHKLNHPNIIKLFGACHDSTPPFFVCEDAVLGNLDSFLYTHDKSRTMVWRLLYQTSLGLAYLHHKKIVHGDLKCNNILIGADKNARLGDFGLSFIRSESKTMSKKDQSGAIQWIAPECLTGEVENPLFASDVYSLGMCIIEAFKGLSPWGYYIDQAVVHRVTEGNMPSCPENMSDEGWELVTQMCARDHTQRLPMVEVVKQLQIFAEQEEEYEEIAEMDQVQLCRKCYARNSREHRFCGTCATKLEEDNYLTP